MARTRAADDFATIRARLEELRRERELADAEKKTDLQTDLSKQSGRSIYWPDGERGAGPNRDRRSGPIHG